jgi:hypothetical protein
LTPLYHTGDSLYDAPYEYYELNGSMNISANKIKIQPNYLEKDIILIKGIFPKNKKWGKDKYEKAILKWRKKNCI